MKKTVAKKSSKALVPSIKNRPTDDQIQLSGESGIGGLFVPDAAMPQAKKLKVVSMSPMIKPDYWVKNFGDKTLRGEFKKIFETTPAKNKVGCGVEIVPPGSPMGVAIPCTATLRQGLEISGEGKAATSPNIGKIVRIKLLPDRLASKKGQDAWHFIVAIEE